MAHAFLMRYQDVLSNTEAWMVFLQVTLCANYVCIERACTACPDKQYAFIIVAHFGNQANFYQLAPLTLQVTDSH